MATMTLVRLADVRGTAILIDTHIRASADDTQDDTPDVGKALRNKLNFDNKHRPFETSLCSVIPIRIIAAD